MMEKKILTPIKSMRAKCLDCCAGNVHEVKICSCVGCPLWIYRNGHKPTQSTTKQYLSGKPLVSTHKETIRDDSVGGVADGN